MNLFFPTRSDLFNFGILSISAASLVFLFSSEASRRDLPGISKPVILRLGPVAIVCLLATAIFSIVAAFQVPKEFTLLAIYHLVSLWQLVPFSYVLVFTFFVLLSSNSIPIGVI